MMRPEEELICRIFEQTIEDYNLLKKKKVAQHQDDSGFCSFKDIEVFLGGKWCARLLEMIDSKLTGKDILHKIEAQCA